jgi:hypothetical protein
VGSRGCDGGGFVESGAVHFGGDGVGGEEVASLGVVLAFLSVQPFAVWSLVTTAPVVNFWQSALDSAKRSPKSLAEAGASLKACFSG